MRYVEEFPGDPFFFAGGLTLNIPRNTPLEAVEVLIKMPALKDITDAWEKVVTDLVTGEVAQKLNALGAGGEVVYTADVRSDYQVILCFYAGPRRM